MGVEKIMCLEALCTYKFIVGMIVGGVVTFGAIWLVKGKGYFKK